MHVMETNLASYHQIASLHLLQNFLKDAKASQQNRQQIQESKSVLSEENSSCNQLVAAEKAISKINFTTSMIEYQKKVHQNLRSINDNLSQMLQESFAGIDNICNRVRLCMLENTNAGHQTQCDVEQEKVNETDIEEYVIIEENSSQTTNQQQEKEKLIETTDTETQTIKTNVQKEKRVKKRRNRKSNTDLENAEERLTSDTELQTVIEDNSKRERRVKKQKKAKKQLEAKTNNEKENAEEKDTKTIFKPFFTVINSPNTSTVELMKIDDFNLFDDALNKMVATIQKEIRCSYAYLDGMNKKILNSDEADAKDEAPNPDNNNDETPDTDGKINEEPIPAAEPDENARMNTAKHLTDYVSDAFLSDNDIASVSDSGAHKNDRPKPILEKLIYAEPDVYRKRACTNLYAKLLAQIEANDSYIFFQKLMGNCQKNMQIEEDAEKEKDNDKDKKDKDKEKKVDAPNTTKKSKKAIEKPQSFSWSWSKTNLHKAQKQEDLSKKYQNSLWFKTKKSSRRCKKRPLKEGGDKKKVMRKSKSQKSVKTTGSAKSIPNNKDNPMDKYQVTVTNDMRLSTSDKCRLYWMRTKYSQMLYHPSKYPDILDKITNKDILPLKSEYPGKHKQHPFRKHVKDTYLYKMMFGEKKVVENAWSQFFEPASILSLDKFQSKNNILLNSQQTKHNSASSFLSTKNRRGHKNDAKNIIKTKTSPSLNKKIEPIQKETSRGEMVKRLSKYIFPGDPTKIQNEKRVFTIMPVHVFYDNIQPRREVAAKPPTDVTIKLPLVPMKETKEVAKKAEWSAGTRQNHKPMRVIMNELPKKQGKDKKIESARDKDGSNSNLTRIQSSGSWCPKGCIDKLPMKSCIHKTQSFNTNNNNKDRQVRIKLAPKPLRQDSSSSSKNVTQESSVKNFETIKEDSLKNLTHLKTMEGSLKSLVQQLKAKEGSLKSLQQYRAAFRNLSDPKQEPNDTKHRKENVHIVNNCTIKTSDIPKTIKPPNFRSPILNLSNKSKPSNDYLNLEAYGKTRGERMSDQERKIWQNKYGKSTGKKLVKFIENQPSEYKIPTPRYALPQQTKSKSSVRQEQVLHHLQNLKHKNDAIQGNIQKAIDVIENKMVDILSKPDISKSIDAFDEMEKEVSSVLKMMKVNKKKEKAAAESTKTIEEVSKISDELFKKLQNILDCDDVSSTNSSSRASAKGDKTKLRKKKIVKKPNIEDPASTSADEKCCVTSYYSPKMQSLEKPKSKFQKTPRTNQPIVNMSLVNQEGPAGDKIKRTIEKKMKTAKPHSEQKPIEQGDAEKIRTIDIATSDNLVIIQDRELSDKTTSAVKVDSSPIQTEQEEQQLKDVPTSYNPPVNEEKEDVPSLKLPENKEEEEENEDLLSKHPSEKEQEIIDEEPPQEIEETPSNIEEIIIEQEPKDLGVSKKEEEIQTSANEQLDTEEELYSGTIPKDEENQTSGSDDKSIQKSSTRCFATSTDETHVDETMMACPQGIKIDAVQKSNMSTYTETENINDNDKNVKYGIHTTDQNVKMFCEKEDNVEDHSGSFMPYKSDSIAKAFQKLESGDKNMYDCFSKIIMRAEDVYSKLNEFELEAANETVEDHTHMPQNIQQDELGTKTLNVKLFQETVSVEKVESQTFLTPFMQSLKDNRKSSAGINVESVENSNESVVPKIESTTASPRIERSPSYYNVINFLETLTDDSGIEKCVEVHYPRLCYYAHQVHYPVVSYLSSIEHTLQHCTMSTGCLKKPIRSLKSSKYQHRVKFRLSNDHKAIQTTKSETRLKRRSKKDNEPSVGDHFVTDDSDGDENYQSNETTESQYQNDVHETTVTVYQSDTSIYQDAYDMSIAGGAAIDNHCCENVMKTSKQPSSSESCAVEKEEFAINERGHISDQKTDVSISLDENSCELKDLKTEHSENKSKILSGSYNKDSLSNLREQKKKSLKVKKRDSLEKFLLKREISREILEEKQILNFPAKSVWTFLDVDLLKTAVGKRQKLRMLRRKNNKSNACKAVGPAEEDKQNILKGFYVMVYLLVFTALNFDYKCL